MRRWTSSWVRSIDDAHREPQRRLSARVRRQGPRRDADGAEALSDEASRVAAGAVDRAARAGLDLRSRHGGGRRGPRHHARVRQGRGHVLHDVSPASRRENFVRVCTTSPGNICGAEGVLKAFLEHSGAGDAGATSPDGKWTIIEVECLGACGFPTPVLVNDDFLENVTPEKVSELVRKYR